jgi:hypothetical protein
MKIHAHSLLRRSKVIPVLSLILILIGLSMRSAVGAQGTGAGFGVGQGQGLEIGINLTAINAVRTDINAGLYDTPCPPDAHDRTKWHSLVNVERRCHFDHIHGDDPNYVNDIFGEPGAWFGAPGQSISYPWQTFPAATANEPNTQYVADRRMENDLKHEGYIWVVRRDQNCPSGNCVRDFRLQTHAIFGAHDMPVRYHSFSIEARLCANGSNLSTCGIVRYGGWIDMGRLFTTQPGVINCNHSVQEIFIPLPADTLYRPIDRPESRDEIRCHPNITNLPAYPSSRPLAEWWGHGGGETRFQVRVYDPIGNVNTTDPAAWQFFCRQDDMNCRYDASIFSVFIGYTLHIHSSFGSRPIDSDRNGRTDLVNIYATRWGGSNNSCTAPGLDCIPFKYDNVVLNFFNNQEARYTQTVCENCTRFDHDISPPGQRWITWFYRYAAGGQHTPTPGAPTATPTLPPAVTPTYTPTTQASPASTPTYTPTTEPPPVGPAVVVNVNPAQANMGENVAVTLQLVNVTDLYGLQTECTVDPNVLVGQSRVDGDGFNSGNSFFVDSNFDPADGTWSVAASRLKPNPAIAGNATAYTLNYLVQNVGSTNVNCAVLAVDSSGHELPVEVINGTYAGGGEPPVTESPTTEPPTLTPTTAVPTETSPVPPPTGTPEVGPFATVSGVVQYQNAPDNSGIAVKLLSNGAVVTELVTGADGAFSFSNVAAGSYTVEASADLNLALLFNVNADGSGQAIDLGTHTLVAGDTDDSGVIDIADATWIGANFDVPMPPAPPNADLNRDQIVNISDLVLVGGNFGLAEPVPVE